MESLNKLRVVNVRTYFSDEAGDDSGMKILEKFYSNFSCDKNLDVENFLKKQSIEFTKKNQSVTYLVFTNDTFSLVGYFTLAIKPIVVPAKGLSNTMKRKIARVSKFDEEKGSYTLAAYLIAQLGKNYSENTKDKITGKQLLSMAIDKIKELQYRAGGMVIFLEAEEHEKLMNFYEVENGFKRFDRKEVNGKDSQKHELVQLLKVM